MRHREFLLPLACGLALGGAIVWAAQTASLDATTRPAPSGPVAVVDGFHAALAAGDIPAALDKLADNVIVFESGNIERGKAEYAALHAPADGAFTAAVPSKIVHRAGQTFGDTAWVLTEGRSTGTYKNNPVDRRTTETMQLRREDGIWRIVHIHWSSGAPRPGN
jgi:ketosteroid isomerase-like protein